MRFSTTRLRAALLVSFVAAFFVLPCLGQWIIATADEARFALLARDVLERGSWFDLYYRGQLFRAKPPLYPWTIAAASRLVGRVTEATAHAPVVLAAIGAVLLTFQLGERLFDRRVGVWAALILSTTCGFLHMSQHILPDMLVLCFDMLAGYAFWRSMTAPSRAGSLVIFYVAVALAVFAKGPVGLIPLLAAGVWLWTEHGGGGLWLLWTPTGIGLFVMITLLWVGPFVWLGARTWMEHSIWGDWLTWYIGPPVGLVRFLHSVIVWSLPWTPVGILAIASAVRERQARAVRFTLLWFTVPFLVLMLSSHQKTRYLLPIYPGAALLVARWAAAYGTKPSAVGRAIGSLALGGALVTSVALHMPAWWGSEEGRYLLDVPRPVLFTVVVGIGVTASALFWGLHAGRPALLVRGVVIGMAIVWGASIWPLNKRHNEIWDFRQFAATVNRHARGGAVAIYQHRDKWGPIDFYLGRSPRSVFTIEQVIEHLTRGEGFVVLMDNVAWDVFGPQLSQDIRVLHRVTVGPQTLIVLGYGRWLSDGLADLGVLNHQSDAWPG